MPMHRKPLQITQGKRKTATPKLREAFAPKASTEDKTRSENSTDTSSDYAIESGDSDWEGTEPTISISQLRNTGSKANTEHTNISFKRIDVNKRAHTSTCYSLITLALQAQHQANQDAKALTSTMAPENGVSLLLALTREGVTIAAVTATFLSASTEMRHGKATSQPPSMSPQATRHAMLKTELTPSLRRDLLNEHITQLDTSN